MKNFFAAGLAMLMLLAPTAQVLADKIKIQPMFTYGESLNEQQFQQTRQTLGVQDGAQEIKVHINELNGLLHDSYPYYQVYSSAYITPADNQGGVTVNILTPQTITSITPRQYENAAVTAGAVDVNINVASAVQVDGSGALAGVYKAFQESGHQLNQEAVGVAQDELGVASKITEENKGKKGYSDDALNAAIAEIKAEIQKAKEENKGNISNEQIQVIINNVINNYNLNNVLSQENIDQLQNLMQKFSQIELTDEQKDALTKLGQDLLKSGDELLKKAKTSWDSLDDNKKQEISQQATSIWQQFLNFLKNIFSIFNK